MSKVIKSISVKIESPKTVGRGEAAVCSQPVSFRSFNQDAVAEPDNHLQTIDENPMSEASPGVDVDLVKNQASEILRETEEMVKELLQTARQEAEKIISAANEEARRLAEEGQDRLKQNEEEAYQRGWLAGCEEGRRHAKDECLEQLEEARKTVEKAWVERKSIVAGSEDEIVQLAVAVARKIIGSELTANPEAIVDIVKRAINKAGDREELTVRVHPDNLESAMNCRESIAQSAKGVSKLKILADPAISPGGCVVETPNGNVDARVESQLNEIKQAIMEVGPNA